MTDIGTKTTGVRLDSGIFLSKIVGDEVTGRFVGTFLLIFKVNGYELWSTLV